MILSPQHSITSNRVINTANEVVTKTETLNKTKPKEKEPSPVVYTANEVVVEPQAPSKSKGKKKSSRLWPKLINDKIMNDVESIVGKPFRSKYFLGGLERVAVIKALHRYKNMQRTGNIKLDIAIYVQSEKGEWFTISAHLYACLLKGKKDSGSANESTKFMNKETGRWEDLRTILAGFTTVNDITFVDAPTQEILPYIKHLRDVKLTLGPMLEREYTLCKKKLYVSLKRPVGALELSNLANIDEDALEKEATSRSKRMRVVKAKVQGAETSSVLFVYNN